MTYKRLNDIINEAVNRIVEEAEVKEKKANLTESEKEKIISILTEAKKKNEDKKKSEERRKQEKKKASKKVSKKNLKIKVMRHQVVTMLNQDKFDMAAIGRVVYPDMDEDNMRSLVSRYANGKEEIPDKRVPAFYNALRSSSKGRKGKTY